MIRASPAVYGVFAGLAKPARLAGPPSPIGIDREAAGAPAWGDPSMVTHAGKGLRRKAASAAAEIEQERARLREELLQRILAREIRRQAMRRAPR